MLQLLGKNAKKAAVLLGKAGIEEKNQALLAVADALEAKAEYLIEENQKDIEHAKQNQMSEALIDRLALNETRVAGMAEGIRQVVSLIGIIYESRPNVTADAFSLTFKTGNAVILRGGSDAIHSNTAITNVIRQTLEQCGVTPDAIQLVTDTSRETATKMMQMNGYIDVLIPRGGAGLIRSVVQNATVPVIETGTGNCHVYVDQYADLSMAVKIVDNAKTQRLGTCNTCESLVVHKEIAEKAVPAIVSALKAKDIEIRGDERSMQLDSYIIPAAEEDWGTEYLDRIISLKIVDDIDEAIAHINRYNTKHSEAIVTQNYHNAQKFLDEIDAAAVYVNASTRFTDGFEFGFGAEIGISTQKIHARGPMGLEALTTTKYIIYGDGQIRS